MKTNQTTLALRILVGTVVIIALALPSLAGKDSGGSDGPTMVTSDLEVRDLIFKGLTAQAVRMLPQAWERVELLVDAELRLPGVTADMRPPNLTPVIHLLNDSPKMMMYLQKKWQGSRHRSLPQRDPELFALLKRLTHPEPGQRSIFDSLKRENLRITPKETCPNGKIASTKIGAFGAEICLNLSVWRQLLMYNTILANADQLMAVISHELAHHAQEIHSGTPEEFQELEDVAHRLQTFFVEYIKKYDEINTHPKIDIRHELWAYTDFSQIVDVSLMNNKEDYKVKIELLRDHVKKCNSEPELCHTKVLIKAKTWATYLPQVVDLDAHMTAHFKTRIGVHKTIPRQIIVRTSPSNQYRRPQCPFDGAKITLEQHGQVIAETTWQAVPYGDKNGIKFLEREWEGECVAIFYLHDKEKYPPLQ